MGALTLRKAWMAGKWAELKKKGHLDGNPEPAEFVEKELWAAAYGGTVEERTAGKVKLEEGATAWVGKVERLILIGSMDLGWHLSHHFGFAAIIVAWVARQLVRPFTPWTTWPVLDCEKGTPFVENLRIQWARLLHEMDANKDDAPLFIQLFGTRDRYVGPMEGVDPLFLPPPHQKTPNSGKYRYVCIEVPESGHEDLALIADSASLTGQGKSREEIGRAQKRRGLMIESLIRAPGKFSNIQAHLAEDSQLHKPNPKVTDVVFVIHGIRDAGYWTQHLAQRIKALSSKSSQTSSDPPKEIRFVSETSTYGYFAMLPFISSGTRRNKVQWLFNEYTDNAVRYPKARFHFVGHSNGTYLLASAMERSSCIRFVNVAFAGSVVRRDYPWPKLKEARQVSRVANYLATTDWVVAVFPWFIGRLQVLLDWLSGSLLSLPPKRDLGSAGDLGFRDFDRKPDLVNVPPVTGGHGAAVEERNWDCLASFILGGDAVAHEKKKRKTIVLVFWRLFFAALAVLLFWGICFLWPWRGGLPTWQHGVGYALGLLLLQRILTRL